MTMINRFYETPIFDVAEELFSELPSGTYVGRPNDRISRVPGKYLKTAMAAAAVTFIAFSTPDVSATTPRLGVTRSPEAEAAVKVPRLTPQQAEAARMLRGAFQAVPTEEDAEGEDPDYGF